LRKRVFCWGLVLVLAVCSGCATGTPPSTPTPLPVPQTPMPTSPPDIYDGTNTIAVGTSDTPVGYEGIMGLCQEDIEGQGYILQTRHYPSIPDVNDALLAPEKDLFLSFSMTQSQMERNNAKGGVQLVSLGAVCLPGAYAVYAGKTRSLGDLGEGSLVIIPEEGETRGRALHLLADNGLIALSPGAGLDIGLDAVADRKGLSIETRALASEEESLQVLAEADAVVMGSGVASMEAFQDYPSLAVEGSESLAAQTHAMIITARREHAGNEKYQIFAQAMRSDAMRTRLQEAFSGAVVPMF